MQTDTDTDTLLKTYATNVRKYHSTMTVTYNSSTLQHYNVKRHQLLKFFFFFFNHDKSPTSHEG